VQQLKLFLYNPDNQPAYTPHYIFNNEGCDWAYDKLREFDSLYLDIETYSECEPLAKGDKPALDPFRNKVRLVSLSSREDTFVFDLLRLGEKCRDLIWDLISKREITGHNLKFDLKTLAYHYGRNVIPSRCYDTYIAARLLWAKTKAHHAPKGILTLENVVKLFLGIELDKTYQTSDFSGFLTEGQIQYAMRDSSILIPLRDKLDSLFKGDMRRVSNIEMTFLPELVKMELAGIPVDKEALEGIKREAEEEIKPLMQEFIKVNVNPNSPIQVKKHLTQEGIKVTSTKNEFIKPYKDNSFVGNLINYRGVKKKLELATGYSSVKVDDRLHPNFTQLQGHAGRMACSDPNVQQIPRKFKKSFYKAWLNRVIFGGDYPAIELRIASIVARESILIQAFREGIDPHKLTASRLMGCNMDQVSDEDRYKAKAVNFGFIYGMMAETFQTYAYANYDLKLSLKEAELFRERFFDFYRGFKAWHERTSQSLWDSDTREIIVRTLTGREVKCDKLTNALNAPVQGTGADMLKISAARFSRLSEELGYDAYLINLIHDEEVVDSSVECEAEAKELLKNCMEDAVNSIIPPTDFVTRVEIKNK
jgi:DNA polymerase-1